MKIGILTYHFANNYGAVLQAHALQTYLKEQGIDVVLVNFQTKTQSSNNSAFRTEISLGNIARNIARIPFARSIHRRIENFRKFRNEYLNLCEPISGIEELSELIRDEDYNCVVVGSDQVWNPNVEDFNEAYYLRDIKCKKIAYAVSIGNASIDQIRLFEKEIDAFSSIFLRDERTKDVIGSVGYKNQTTLEVVVDPVLLLNKAHWQILMRNSDYIIPFNDYILCYYLRRKGANQFKKNMLKLSGKLGIPVLFINSNYGLAAWGKNTINDAGPLDFLKLVYNAKYVCTNSFHATMFSVMFNKKFFCIADDPRDKRIENTLRMFGMEKHLLIDYSINNIEEVLGIKQEAQGFEEIVNKSRLKLINAIE